ncbi:hypothetical protein M422DRAFT_263267 [Sphaerobolus stellatus SS14]|uniref:Leucine-rich repeat-containing protein sog2 n=1 Tax=Sphaerobolus stellatus (strain SS14) TaxID=990650 RepID=A0A0C9VBJ4_SPHS4|nr:hypothetical protein M422DRAFT_263267 [Sphaerobolus stellatus SS14]
MERRGQRRPSSPRPLWTENAEISTILTYEHVAQAVQSSSDGGMTLDFSQKNISDVSESVARELASFGNEGVEDERKAVLRIALGSNRLTSLPKNFALLSRLRYLNLRANCFTTFPDVLTLMPSLEIIDLSRNKLKELPSNPGTLLGLRVFSLSKNKLTRLPAYLAGAINLTVLQIDHNPLEWPPKEVLEPLEAAASEPDIMAAQIGKMRNWMRTHTEPPISQDYQQVGISDGELTSTSPDNAEISGGRHERNISVESDISNYSLISQESTDSVGLFLERLQLDASRSPLSSPSALSPSGGSQDASTVATDHSASREYDGQDSLLHARNASYSTNRRPSPSDFRLMTKKSLPELRRVGTNRTDEPQVPALSDPDIINASRGSKARTTRKASLPSDNADPFLRESTRKINRIVRPHPQTRQTNTGAAAEMVSPTISGGPAPSMDMERNSYFRRLSTLPVSSVASTMPQALLAMIDSARGILFGVSQIYQSLRHYTVFAIDDRLSGLLGKVLDPASTYITHLINALDKFDSSSRRGIPSPTICRAVVESCRDNTAVFGKVIGVLHLQLKVLAGADDARYSRSLLLMLYGSMGEIANSWHIMESHLDDMVPYLSEHRIRQAKGSAVSKSQTSNIPAAGDSKETKSATGDSRHAVASPVNRSLIHAGEGRSRMARRHAGSFSTRDLEIGKTLPSTSQELLPNGSVLRSALRKPQSSPQNTPILGGNSPSADFAPSIVTSRYDSPTPNGDGRSSPFSFGSSRQHVVHSTPRSTNISSLDVPSDSSKMVDEDLLNTMEAATETARSVWKMMDEVIPYAQEANVDLPETLDIAVEITTRLKSRISAMRKGSGDSDRKTFWEDAHFFVKVCYRERSDNDKVVVGFLLSSAQEQYSKTYSIDSRLRYTASSLFLFSCTYT